MLQMQKSVYKFEGHNLEIKKIIKFIISQLYKILIINPFIIYSKNL